MRGMETEGPQEAKRAPASIGPTWIGAMLVASRFDELLPWRYGLLRVLATLAQPWKYFSKRGILAAHEALGGRENHLTVPKSDCHIPSANLLEKSVPARGRRAQGAARRYALSKRHTVSW